ncbi:unnamed protein product, partial [Rotaria sordida]
QKLGTGNFGIHPALINSGGLSIINGDPSSINGLTTSGDVIRRNKCVIMHPTSLGS